MFSLYNLRSLYHSDENSYPHLSNVSEQELAPAFKPYPLLSPPIESALPILDGSIEELHRGRWMNNTPEKGATRSGCCNNLEKPCCATTITPVATCGRTWQENTMRADDGGDKTFFLNGMFKLKKDEGMFWPPAGSFFAQNLLLAKIPHQRATSLKILQEIIYFPPEVLFYKCQIWYW